MSLTPSPRLLLKRNDGADPFLRQDFIDNWDKLDLAPGVHICTSGSRPTWGVAQAGRQIFETDMRRPVVWTGTTWIESLTVAGSWAFTQDPNQFLNPSVSANYSMGSIAMVRPSAVLVIATVRAGTLPSTIMPAKYINCSVLIDGVNRDIGVNSGYMKWAPLPSGIGGDFDFRTTTYFGQATLSSASHTLHIQVTTGPGGSSLYVGSVSAVVIRTALLGGVTVAL